MLGRYAMAVSLLEPNLYGLAIMGCTVGSRLHGYTPVVSDSHLMLYIWGYVFTS